MRQRSFSFAGLVYFHLLLANLAERGVLEAAAVEACR